MIDRKGHVACKNHHFAVVSRYMKDIPHIRNFSIIAHIDHGKSTLADRMLETTQTVERRKMREQVLDSMDLERERGITIKMQPVRMEYASKDGGAYILNLIDTPGHIDFSYEVSRSLKAVEGALLLVDATQGVQAQTLTTLSLAQDLNLVIIPVMTKIDSPIARPDEVRREIADLLVCDEAEVLAVSGKTGEGVPALLEAIVARIPPPSSVGEVAPLQALVFDFEYSTHRGVIVYARIFGGSVKAGDQLLFAVTGQTCTALEVGVFRPGLEPRTSLAEGESGYIVTGIKDAAKAVVGDTLVSAKRPAPALPGYQHPQPVVWASLYPESQDDFLSVRHALERLKLSDSSLSFEEESSSALGRGFRCGFLGMLHLEIVAERLKREFDLELILTAPSIMYEVVAMNGSRETIYSPVKFPEKGTYRAVYEPWITLTIIVPVERVGDLMQVLYAHEVQVKDSASFSDTRVRFDAEMPLRELMRGFFDKVKSASSGYASFSYEMADMREAHVARLDVLVADEVVPAFSQVIAEHRVNEEGKAVTEKLSNILPRQLFVVKIQAKALGRIIASKTLSAMRKDVTGYLYGGDITRKKKLLEKQKKGKKKMKERGSVNIPHEVFLKMVRSE